MASLSTIRVRPPNGEWVTLGVEHGVGYTPEGESWSATEAGPDTGSFTVRRDSTAPWIDLQPLAEVEVEAMGSGIVWSGRIWDLQYPSADTISVTCRGWQHALDDDMFERLYVRAGLDGCQDLRSVNGVPHTFFSRSNGFDLVVGDTITFRMPNGMALTGPAFVDAVVIDMGSACAKTVAVEYAGASGQTGWDIYLRGSSDKIANTDITQTNVDTSTMGAAGTLVFDLASARRYVTVLSYVAGSITMSADRRVQVTNIRVFGETTYENGSGGSALTADTVLKDVRANMLAWANTDETLITTTATIIGDLWTQRLGGRYASPRQIVQAVNAHHDYLLGVDALKRVFFKARPTDPIIEVGEWAGAQITDSGETAEELYNRVIVTYTDPGGVTQTEVRTSSSPVLSKSGFTRAKILQVNSPVSASSAQTIGDAWLAGRTRRPLRGSIIVTGAGGARYIGLTAAPATVNPADLLRHPGQRVRLTDRWDPDDGGWGRDGTITAVTWTPEADTATLTLESPRDRLDVLLGRLAATRSAGLPLA